MVKNILLVCLLGFFLVGATQLIREVEKSSPTFFSRYLRTDTLIIGDSTYTNTDFISFRDNFENEDRTIYVSQYVGNDTTGNGSDTAQFRTLLKGMQSVLNIINNVDITFNIDSGSYDLSLAFRDEFNKKERRGNGRFIFVGSVEELESDLPAVSLNDDPTYIDVPGLKFDYDAKYLFLGRDGNLNLHYPISDIDSTSKLDTTIVECSYFSFSSSVDELYRFKTIFVNSDNDEGFMNYSVSGPQVGNGEIKFNRIVIESNITASIESSNKFEHRGVLYDLAGASQTSLRFTRNDPCYVNGVKVLINASSRAGITFSRNYVSLLYALLVKNINGSTSSAQAVVFAGIEGGTIRGALFDNFDSGILLTNTKLTNNGGYIKAKNCNTWLESDKQYYRPEFNGDCELVVENVEGVFKLDCENGVSLGNFTQVGNTNSGLFFSGFVDTIRQQYPYIYIELDTLQ